MICKTIEVRDSMTFIPCLAVKLIPVCDEDKYLLARSGFGQTVEAQSEYVLLIFLNSGQCTHDPSSWQSRTLKVAHEYVIEKFDEIMSGDVVDVQFILGETKEPKRSERLT